MVILGIDPGIAIVGYGLINYEAGKCSLIGYGTINTPAKTQLSYRLNSIYMDMQTILDRFKPDAIAIEELFFNTNAKTAINVAHARGVLVLAAKQKNIPIYEYTPLQVKQAVVGYGRAEKKQVMEMTREQLKMAKVARPDDAADALALAICHANTLRFPIKQECI